MGKVNNLTIKQKYEAINMIVVDKKKVKDVACHFKCGTTQIYNALKQKADIQSTVQQSKNASKKKRRKDWNEKLNDTVYEWFCIARSKNFPISGPILQEKSIEIARKMEINNFTASNGWLKSFKKNRNIAFQTASGECNDVNQNVVREWKSKLADKVRGYELKNIANADETGLFYKVLPNKTMHMKSEKCHGGKQSKERLTLLLTVFADGTIFKPLVIGKSNKPHCFKNVDKEKH